MLFSLFLSKKKITAQQKKIYYMMTLSEAIRFRHLISQLNPSEQNNFLNNLIHQHKDLVFKALFEYFRPSTEQNSFIDSINCNLNENICNIIRNREKKDSSISQTVLTKLTNALIGETASYLPPKDYVSFSRSNRIIYIATHQPNTLSTIKLSIMMRNISYYPLFHKVKTLQLNYILTHAEQLNKLWSSTIHLENLIVTKTHRADIFFDSQYMKIHLLKLKRIVFYANCHYNPTYDLLKTFSHQLTFIAIDSIPPNLLNINFAKLTELQYFHWYHTIANITTTFATATNLEKVRLNFCVPLKQSDIHSINNMLNVLLSKCHSLHYLEIIHHGNWESESQHLLLWKTIQKNLKNNIHLLQTKQSLKLRLQITLVEQSLSMIPSIKRTLSNIPQWGLCVVVPHTTLQSHNRFKKDIKDLKLTITEISNYLSLIMTGNIPSIWIKEQEIWQIHFSKLMFFPRTKPIQLNKYAL